MTRKAQFETRREREAEEQRLEETKAALAAEVEAAERTLEQVPPPSPSLRELLSQQPGYQK